MTAAIPAFGALIRGLLRLERRQTAGWAAGLFIAGWVSAASTAATYATHDQRVGALGLVVGNPAFLISRGMPQGPEPGAFLFFQMGMVFAVMFAVHGALFAIRHGRAQDEAGILELLRAGAIGRGTPLAAALVAGVVAQAALAVGTYGGFVLGGAEPVGSAWAALALMLVGVSFLTIGAVCGQIVADARPALGLALGVVAIAYLVRAAADALSPVDPHLLVADPAPIAWLSPLSLAELADPYGQVDPAPLALLLIVSVGLAAVGLLLESRRQYGEALIPTRPGRAHAVPGLRSPWRLALRLQRGTLIGMGLAGLGVGAFAAMLTLLGAQVAATDPAIAAVIRTTTGEDGPIYDLLLAYTMLFAAEAAAVAAILAILRARREETTGNAEVVRGTPTHPITWFGSQLAVAVVSALVVIVTCWIGAAAVYLGQGAAPVTVAGPLLAAVTAQLPAVAVYLGVSALAFAAVPRVAPGLSWGLLLVGVFLAEFGGRAGLPDRLVATTPFAHTPLVTIPGTSLMPLIWMVLIAACCAGAAAMVYTRRDLTP